MLARGRMLQSVKARISYLYSMLYDILFSRRCCLFHTFVKEHSITFCTYSVKSGGHVGGS